MKKILKRILGLIPSPLPRKGRSEMDAWVNDIIETYDLPDNDSHRQALLSMILNLAPTVVLKSKFFFAASVMKAATNQIAYDIIMEIRDRNNKPRPGSNEQQVITTPEQVG
jgi:hypothetical protein